MKAACCGLLCVTSDLHRLRTLGLNGRDEKRGEKLTLGSDVLVGPRVD